jgi:2-C-methyl-D-erythritol 4-phosphate cytidylyltransferase
METKKNFLSLKEFIAVLPASGLSQRMSLDSKFKSKLLLELKDNKTVLEHSLKTIFLSGIKSIVIPTTKDLINDIEIIAKKIGEWDNLFVIEGGSTRFYSVFNSLKFIELNLSEHNKFKFVVIHDAARPNCPISLFKEIIENASFDYGLVPGTPVVNTVKKVNKESFVESTLNRDELFEIQTPQVFPIEDLIKSYEFINLSDDISMYFDDSSVYENFGNRVKILLGSKKNIKITHFEDLEFINFYLN